jgi:hypothetical protein
MHFAEATYLVITIHRAQVRFIKKRNQKESADGAERLEPGLCVAGEKYYSSHQATTGHKGASIRKASIPRN